MISLMNSYQARISVTSPILPSRTLTLRKQIYRMGNRNVCYAIVLPENLVLNLKLQFRFKCLRSVSSEGADFEESRGGQSFIQLRKFNEYDFVICRYSYIWPGRHFLKSSVSLAESFLNGFRRSAEELRRITKFSSDDSRTFY